jgi:hypothetical protein
LNKFDFISNKLGWSGNVVQGRVTAWAKRVVVADGGNRVIWSLVDVWCFRRYKKKKKKKKKKFNEMEFFVFLFKRKNN